MILSEFFSMKQGQCQGKSLGGQRNLGGPGAEPLGGGQGAKPPGAEALLVLKLW